MRYAVLGIVLLTWTYEYLWWALYVPKQVVGKGTILSAASSLCIIDRACLGVHHDVELSSHSGKSEAR